jgi:hypothetical protein
VFQRRHFEILNIGRGGAGTTCFDGVLQRHHFEKERDGRRTPFWANMLKTRFFQALSDAKYVDRNRLGKGYPFLVLCRTSTPRDQSDKCTISTQGLSFSRSRGTYKKKFGKIITQPLPFNPSPTCT